MSGPLEGFRIVDLTSMVSGPFATMILADQGADVIKVENPNGGDHSRHVATERGGLSASFANNNRNKRSIVLDLKHAKGIDTVKRLINSADVLVENFRPGVANRLGLGYDDLRVNLPSLVYMSISGFGFTGPYAGKPVFDPLIQALSGLTTVQAGADEERPRLVRTILPDKLTGIQAAQAITAALLARTRTGKGQHVKLAMLDTVIAFLWSSDMGGHSFVGDELDAEVAQSYIDLIYQTVDGYVSIAVMQDKHWTGFANAVNRPSILKDSRFSTARLRDENKNERVELIQDIVRDYAVAQLIELLEEHDVPCAPVLTRREMIKHPQVVANEIVEIHDHPRAGLLRQARHPARFSTTTANYRRGAPGYGENGIEVLDDSGFSSTEIDELIASGAMIVPDPVAT